MATVILDRRLAERVREERAAAGSDRWDEVWEGTYMMAPMPNPEHQELVGGFVDAFRESFRGKNAKIYPGVNVSDREVAWESNYRCPDVAVYLSGNPAKECAAHWCGGPDFAVEIVSDDDRTRDKIPFYASVGTRELLIVERDPWILELLRLKDGKLASVGTASLSSGQGITSDVLRLSFRLEGSDDRPVIKVEELSGGRTWEV
jgi:Uma2 family endonuclease